MKLAACGPGTVVHHSAVATPASTVFLGAHLTSEPLCPLAGAPGGEVRIGDGSPVAAHGYIQGAGGVRIASDVAVGPGVRMLTSVHAETPPAPPLTAAPLRYAIEIGDGCDIGPGPVLPPGVRLAAAVEVGAGAVVRAGECSSGTVVAGVPARVTRMRGDGDRPAGLAADPPARR